MISELLPAPEPMSPAAYQAGQDRLARLQAADRPDGRATASGRRGPSRRRARAWWQAGAVAAAATIAAVAGNAAAVHPGVTRATSTMHLTARSILLAAAAEITHQPAAGAYWVTRDVITMTVAAGSKAHPYNILAQREADKWTASAPGGTDVGVVQDLASGPATAADKAAWRAAGGPRSWTFTEGWAGTFAVAGNGAAAVYRITGNGAVCQIEIGDSPAQLSAARCARLPGTEAALRALLLRLANAWLAQNPPGDGRTMPSAEQAVVTGAWGLLTQPVRPAVDAAALRIIAAYPGVRYVARVTDPLGRPGYALRFAASSGLSTELIIGAGSGRLLSSCLLYGTAAGWAPHRHSWYYIGNTYHAGFYGSAWYPGMAAQCVIVREQGWTNSPPGRG
jgi:uncharacterized protein YfiM (DUF2279 family)